MSATALAGASEPAASVPISAIKRCAAIEAPAERLACYDRLAGPAAAPRAAQAAPMARPAAPSKEAFGLYRAEHPAPPATKIAAKVTAIGASDGGHPTVALEGGQLWEIDDDPDPLLAAGDTVTIRRAALGSFLMATPTGRVHRVRRLR